MTKEDLVKEAEEKYIERLKINGIKLNIRNQTYNDAYVMGAEPREKQIAILGKRVLQLQKDKGELTDKLNELEKKYQELVDKLHHCWNCKKSFDKSCSFGKMLEADKKKCKDWDSTFGISD